MIGTKYVTVSVVSTFEDYEVETEFFIDVVRPTDIEEIYPLNFTKASDYKKVYELDEPLDLTGLSFTGDVTYYNGETEDDVVFHVTSEMVAMDDPTGSYASSRMVMIRFIHENYNWGNTTSNSSWNITISVVKPLPDGYTEFNMLGANICYPSDWEKIGGQESSGGIYYDEYYMYNDTVTAIIMYNSKWLQGFLPDATTYRNYFVDYFKEEEVISITAEKVLINDKYVLTAMVRYMFEGDEYTDIYYSFNTTSGTYNAYYPTVMFTYASDDIENKQIIDKIIDFMY